MAFVLKQVVMAVEATVAKEYRIKLNPRLGFLKFSTGKFFFDNMPQAGDLDGVTSSNTEYRVNKRFLTNIRERRSNAQHSTVVPDDQTTFYSSVVSTIRGASTQKSILTPKGRSIDIFQAPNHLASRALSSHRGSRASSTYNYANPNPQTSKGRLQRPNVETILRKQADRTGPPQLMDPIYSAQDKFGKKVVFPVDQVSRVDFDKLYAENRDYILQQAMLGKEKRALMKEENLDEDQDYLEKVQASLDAAKKKKKELILRQREYCDQ